MIRILGVGLASPLGLGRKPTLTAWLSDQTGHQPNDRWPTDGFPRRDAGLVEGFVPRRHLPNRKAVKLMSRESQLAVFAAVEAAEGTGLVERLGVDATRIGAFAAAGYEVSSLQDSEAMLASSRDPNDSSRIELSRLFSCGRDVYNPLSPLKVLPNMPLFHAGLALGLQGPHLSLGSSPASGLAALGEAKESIEGGDCEAALVLGSDAQVEEFRAQLLVEAGVLPALAPSEGAASLLLAREGIGPKIVAWDVAQEPLVPPSGEDRLAYGQCEDAGATRARLYARVLKDVGPVDLCLTDLWGEPTRDAAELHALSQQTSIQTNLVSSRTRLGWLGAAQGLVDIAIASELLRSGRAKRALVTASGLAGDLAAVVLESST